MAFDRRVIGAVPVAAVAGALSATLMLGGRGNSVIAQDTANITQEQRATATSLEGAFVKIAETVRPATVYIQSRVDVPVRTGALEPNDDDPTSPFGDLPFLFRGMPRGGGGGGSLAPRFSQASGSGVIVRQDGYIITNDHVVAGARDNSVSVTLDDGRKFTGKVIRDPRSDLAIVKINAGRPLPYVRMANSEQVKVGQWAVAIGSPFGQQGTMTAGIVSALGRKDQIGSGTEARFYPNLIQTDASINPGNSGGPLLNINGELIGVNVAIESPSGTSAGIGFAIPSNTARGIMDQLITRGKVVRGYLGLQPADIPANLRERLGTERGAYVVSVSADTPARAAGIRAGDVVTRFGGKDITSEIALREAISAAAPGDKVEVTLRGIDGQTRTTTVTVGTIPSDPEEQTTPAQARPTGKLGITTGPLAADIAREMKLDAGTRGVLVGRVEPGTPAADAGLLTRDVITAINGKPLATPEALTQTIASLKPGDVATLSILRMDGGPNAKPSEAVVNVTIP